MAKGFFYFLWQMYIYWAYTLTADIIYPSKTSGETSIIGVPLLYLHKLDGIFLALFYSRSWRWSERTEQIQYFLNFLFSKINGLPSCSEQRGIIFVTLPIKNHLVPYFENKQTSNPVHMVNINIFLSIKYTGIPSYFFGFQHNGSDNVAAQKYWGFGTACYLLSQDYHSY